MTYDEWTPIFRTLCKAKDRKLDGEQGAALFDVLKEFPQACVHQACFRAAREVSGWPKSDRLVDLARDERRKLITTSLRCGTCYGSTWVPGSPREFSGLQYATVERCPDCWTLPSPSRPSSTETEITA